MPILNRQRRRALERSDRNVTAEDLLLAYVELHAEVVKLAQAQPSEAQMTALMNKCLDERELAIRQVTDDATKALAAIMDAEPRLRQIVNDAVSRG